MSDPQPVHATLVARYTPGGWLGLLLRGPSGVGKSALALALIGKGWRLVADDRVRLWRCGGRVWGRAPDRLRGLLEVRGVGVLSFPALDCCEINWLIDGAQSAVEIERIPEQAVAELIGVSLPTLTLDVPTLGAADRALAFCGAVGV